MALSLKSVWLWVIGILLVHSMERLWHHREAVLDLVGLGPVYVPRPIDHTEENWWRPLPHKEVALEVRQQRAEEDSDTFYNPTRASKDYWEKIRKHNFIATYLTATRRTDPQYMRVMELLASRGYGVLEWRETCGLIINRQLIAPIQNRRLQNADADRVAVDEEVAFDLIQGEAFWAERLARVFGLVDMEFFRELLAIPLEIKNNEPALGFPGRQLEVGVRFFTDADWLTPEIVAAQAAYEGPARSEWTVRLRREFAEFLRRSRLRGYGRSLPEKRDRVQALLDAGMIQPDDLDGVEIVEIAKNQGGLFFEPELLPPL